MSTRLHSRQAGMVSIMVTMIMMLVVTLIVLGFAQISRREQRQSLDRQLSTQAFFAAESAVNDARDTITKTVAAGGIIPEKATCGKDGNYNSNPVIDADGGVSYSCLLVSTRLKNLSINPLTAGGNSVSIPLEPAGVMAGTQLNWNSLGTQTDASVGQCAASVPATATFPKVSTTDWKCPYGVLRVDFVPTDKLSRAALTSGQKTLFFYPTKATGLPLVDYNATNTGAVVGMQCQAASGCQVDLTNIPSTDYGLRLTAIYNTGSVNITAKNIGGEFLELKNAQIQVDATGKAQDVLRRIQVRLPMQPAAKTPDYAIQSGSSICKRYEIGPDTFTIPNTITGQDQNNPMCRPTAVKPKVCTGGAQDVLLILDISGSMNDKWQSGTRLSKMKDVANRLVGSGSAGPDANHFAVITFGSRSDLLQGFTSDVSLLQQQINAIVSKGGTQYIPPLTDARQLILGSTARSGVGKTIVFISDGAPTDDRGDIIDLSNFLKKKGVALYTIGIASFSSGGGILSDMAGAGGYFTSADQEAELEQAIGSIATEVECS